MKPTDTLTTLFRHNHWANQSLFNRCSTLSSEQLSATISGTFGSIYDTLLHILNAEQSYLARISTGQPYRQPDNAPALSVAEMMESVRTTSSDLIMWSYTVKTGDMVTINWQGTNRDVPKAIILAQVINHATEHRAQIMMTMTQLGIEPPDLDSWSYFDAQNPS